VNALPKCLGCGHGLDRVDHYGIEHTVLDQGIYRDVGVYDEDAAGGAPGIASEVDLRCGYCGASLTLPAKEFFYRRWIRVLEATAALRDGITES